VAELLDIETFVVPADIVEPSLEAIANAGEDGAELFVAWGGVAIDAKTFEFRSATVPRQRSLRTDDGLMVVIEGDALFQLNRELHRRGLTLAGQIHGHPTDAYHSGLDDAWAITTLPGSISVVVPDFARHGRAALVDSEIFRLDRDEAWKPFRPEGVAFL
jgi:hypothetical protein